MKNNKLEIGDILFEHRNWGGMQKHKVVRLTPKQAVLDCGDICCIDVSEPTVYDPSRYSKKIGSYGRYSLSDPELEAQFEMQTVKNKLIGIINRLSISNLPEQEYQKCIDFLSSYEPKQK